ncbi:MULTISPECIES: sugar kinase [Shewanella]|uniref:Sugar kinase n=1 Tax=Shewanella electrodiphila TaxID=934143 RepID=A0ABT0KSW5_9GAMM|nr:MULTISPECIES: sugar kinase [Shewanella]MCC4831592.1 sugar kinase [Shewanella sp. 10N.7]MCL1046694.1 sugar kinase [Shewanella electrodiphila]PMG79388.1 ketodeoxygluconokinase [Shewanella sp. 10N.286.51.B7]
MKNQKIAIIGECMVELRPSGELLAQNFGGDTLNTALYLARLTQGANLATHYVTALGHDPFSTSMKDTWQAEGINTDYVLHVENKQPGLYYIETDDCGERSFYYWRNDAAAKYLFEQAGSKKLAASLIDFDYLYLSGISLAILTSESRKTLFSVLEQFKEAGGKVIFDNNYRPQLWQDKAQAIASYKTMLSFTDIACLTFEDEQALYGDTDVEQCIERTSNLGVSEIVVKLGSEPCLVITPDSRISVAATFVENVVDTTAAGDSFSAGYLAKRLTGGTTEQAAKAGHLLAGTVIQHAGAIIHPDAMPSLG